MAQTPDHEQLKIEVKGPERTSNTYICKLIADALRECGIANMEVINQFGDDIGKLNTADVYHVARRKNPLLDLAGVAIYPEGPVIEEVIVFENRDNNDDEDPPSDDFDPVIELEMEEQ